MRHPRHWLGKYRDLVLAVGLFLLLDLGVLVFNFHTSREIEADTRLINTAGEIRMATQQLTKALLTLAQETRAQEPTQTSLAQLGQARDTLNSGLKLLHAALPETARDPATGESRRLLGELEQHWRPLDRDIEALLGATPETPLDADSVERVSTKASSRNLKLLGQSDDLGRQLEGVAVAKASILRTIQLVAIALATLNFVFIVFKFVHRLQRSDRLADAAREQTALILASVREGLFLIGRDRRIASQHSASLAALLGRPPGHDFDGCDFTALLRELVGEKDAAAAEELVDILFARRLKGELIEQLNPLHEVEIRAVDAEQRRIPRFLNFEFSQTQGQGGALLVTVFDVTQKVLLARELAGSRQKAKGEVELLLNVLELDPPSVTGFIADARAGLSAINDILKTTAANPAAYRRLVAEIARRVHGLKGEAAALGLGAIEQQAHRFEDLLQPLRQRDDLVGADLIPIAVEVAALGEQIQRVEQIVGRVAAFAATPATLADCLPTVLAQARRLGERTALELDKRLRIEVSAPATADTPEPLIAMLREALPQLVRNAVVHGIETPAERERGNKPEVGTVRIKIDADADGTLRVAVRDDGRGLSPTRIRLALVARGQLSAAAVEAMSDQQVVATIFEPGFSTLPAASTHAGRGDGLALVRERIVALGGRLRIASQSDKFTEFHFHVKAPA